jgi:hypothetical protein
MFVQEHSELMDKAAEAISSMFTWDISHADPQRAVPEIERMKKSILTVAGQRKKPGSSMNVILEQSGLLKKEALETNSITKEFVGFIANFMDLKA